MKKVLIVVDMQKDFVTGALGNAECVGAVDGVVREIENPDYDTVLLTKDTHFENYPETQEGRNLPVVHCIKGTDGWELVDAVQAAAEKRGGCTVLEKVTFGCKNLPGYLEAVLGNEAQAAEYTFVGVCTGICVISNAMLVKAFFPEAKVRVISDACACVTPDTHKTALDAMKLCQMEII